MKIIDISQFNNVTSFTKLFNDCDGIIIRLGYRGYGKSGKMVLDKSFKSRIKKLSESGKPFGVYFLPQSINKEEAVAEAFYIIDNLRPYVKDAPMGIWIDSEYGNQNHNGRADNLSASLRTNLINEMLYILKSHGFNCGVYASLDWFKHRLIMSRLDCPFWVAKYGNNNGAKPSTEPDIPYVMWQYTSRGKVNGVMGNVDISEMIVNIESKSEEKVKYFPIYCGNTISIIEALNSIGAKSTYVYRKKIANVNGITGYKGTANQNLKMLDMLKQGVLIKPD